jgi:ferredoxin-NADP reductase
MTTPASLDWQQAIAAAFLDETTTVRSIEFDVAHWAGHLAGQHVDIRLTAADGYQAQRSYSLASPGGHSTRIEITVETITGGEVSPFLTEEMVVGDAIELRGPIGGYFTWEPEDPAPLMLTAGGSGVVPLMSMLRTRRIAGSRVRARLLHSSRTAQEIIYRNELDKHVAQMDGFSLVRTLTRGAPADWRGEARRVDREMLARHVFPAAQRPLIFICGPTSFVEAVADDLVSLGYDEKSIKTERFGPSGEK